jgi:hypothetical protein
LSFGSGGSGALSSKAHPPHVSPHDTAGHQARYPASYTDTPGGRPGTAVAAFLLPFGHRHSLLGRPVPATGFRLPYGRPTTTGIGGGPDGVSTFHTHETRPGRAPSVPRERRCPRDRSGVLGRRLPILNGPPLVILARPPDPGSCRHEASTMVHSRSPFRPSPRLWPPSRSRAPLGFPPGLRTQPLLATHARVGIGPGHRPKSRLRHHVEPPINGLLIACDLVSQLSAARSDERSRPQRGKSRAFRA